MSYILDALRKSESERQQGRIPDLGQQVQLIHKPRKRGVPVGAWVTLALVLNALVLGALFWPDSPWYTGGAGQEAAPLSAKAADQAPAGPGDTDTPLQAPVTQQAAEPSPRVSVTAADNAERSQEMTPEAAGGDVIEGQDRPTVIVPSPNRAIEPDALADSYGGNAGSSERVPHLVELPMSFQKRVPTLIFNSHVYASDPAARRVIINDHYLRMGDTFSGIRVDRITEDGVVLSMDGQRFRVGVVRDWIRPR